VTHDALCRAGSVGILAAVLLAPTVARAAEDATDSNSLQQVLVTAERRSESPQDIGVAITTMSSEEIQTLRIQQPLDLSTISPSLSTMNST
jgi:iron complex outermembrane recepter protein